MEMTESKYKIMNQLSPDYGKRVEVIFSKQVSVEHDTPELFNGFKANFDIYKDIDFLGDKIFSDRTAKPEIKYNYPDQSLYVVVLYHFKAPLTEEEMSTLGEYTNKKLEKEVITGTIGTQEYIISLGNDVQNYLKQIPLEAPEGFIYLDEVFEDKKDNLGYKEFLNHELSFTRLTKLCKKLGYEVTKEMITGVMLPIHRKHETTGAMLVHKDVLHQYQMYKLSQNYITGFDKGTNEYAIGIAMAYDIKFNDYVLRAAKRMEEEGKEPDPDNFTDQFNKAIKRIEEKKYA